MYSVNNVLTGQQAVTASSAPLNVSIAPANNALTVTVKAAKENTIPVYIGPAGVTTATGYELSPGDFQTYLISTPTLLSVVAASTGASISWLVQF